MSLRAELLANATVGSFNPLNLSGTALPPNILLTAKIVALAFLLHGQVSALPEPFLPFVPGLEHLGSPWVVRTLLQAVTLFAAAALLLNRRVRTSCLGLGAAILIAILLSRTYYQNNRLFAGLVLLMAGLYHASYGGLLLRYQVVLLYFAAALNKFLETDWRSGQFFVAWAAVSPYHAIYDAAARLLPGTSLYVLMAWSVIVVEFAITIGFILPRLWPFAIWLGVAYHTSLLMITGRTFGLFWFALLASYLAFVQWPPVRSTVRHSTTGAWQRAAGLRRRLDLVLSSPVTYLVAVSVLAPLPEYRARLGGVVVMAVLAVIAVNFLFTCLRRGLAVGRRAHAPVNPAAPATTDIADSVNAKLR